MLPNKTPHIIDVINSTTMPVVILVTTEICPSNNTNIVQQVENMIFEHPTKVIYYKWYILEEEMVFPRTKTPMLYFFLPNNQNVIIWRDKENMLSMLNDDMTTIGNLLNETINEA